MARKKIDTKLAEYRSRIETALADASPTTMGEMLNVWTLVKEVQRLIDSLETSIVRWKEPRPETLKRIQKQQREKGFHKIVDAKEFERWCNVATDGRRESWAGPKTEAGHEECKKIDTLVKDLEKMLKTS